MIEAKKKLNSKIAFIVPRLCTGGVEINFLNLSNFLVHSFSQIEIVYQSESDAGEYRSKFKEGIVFSKIGTMSGIRMINEFRKYFNSSKPSVIFVSMYVVVIYMLIAKAFSKHKPLIIINGGNHFSSFTNKSKNFKEKYLLPFFAKVTFKYANFFISQCDDMSKDIIEKLKFPAQKIKTIYNPVVPRNLDLNELKIPNHQWFNSNETFPILIMAGRLVPQKRVLEFIDIFNELKSSTDAKLIILGEGPLRNKILNRIDALELKKEVDVVSFKKNYLSYIANSNLLVVNSEYEGLNNMIIHALSCGTNVVATDCPVGPSEILSNGKFGKLVDLNDQSDMQNAILSELNNPTNTSEELIARSKDFTIEKSASQFIKIINELVEVNS